jgi:hypothetical protein
MPKAFQNLDLQKHTFVSLASLATFALKNPRVEQSEIPTVTFFEQTNPFPKTAIHAK